MLAALASNAHAQPASLGPAQCFALAARTTDLSSQQALALCIGAPGDAPARCFVAALDLGMSDQQAIALCAKSATVDPATCAAQLEDSSNLALDTIVGRCATRTSSPAGGPACVQTALELADLSEAQALELCGELYD